MPDFSKFLDFSALFVAIASVLFGSWYGGLEQIAGKAKPPIYRNRKAYISELQSSLVSRSIPLTAFLLIYVFALSGALIATLRVSSLTLNPLAITPAPTLFCLTYALSVYLAIIAGTQLWRLFHAWWAAGQDRTDKEVRITFFR